MINLYDYSGEVVMDKHQHIVFDENVKGIAHRGYSAIAPENTLPSYILAAKKGFKYMETDVCLTSDGVPVLLHDDTIDRTSNGTGTIYNMTLAQVRQYDFGSWKSSEYTGVQIPTLEEYLSLCRSLMLHPYIEIKDVPFTQQQVENVVNLVHKYGLKGKATIMSFNLTYLEYVKDYDDTMRLGYPPNGVPTVNDLNVCKSLQTGKNEVFCDPQYNKVTDAICDMFREEGIPIEVWVVDSESTILSLNPYISAVTSNSLHAGRVLYDNSIENT